MTGLSQIVIFFLLGLLSFPHKFPYIMGTAIVIALFILLIDKTTHGSAHFKAVSLFTESMSAGFVGGA